jgi:hypothetical protein
VKVKRVAPQLLAEKGLGVLIAAKLIGEIAGIDRFTSDAQLARISGCAPIPVSSRQTSRHRLDPGGNRQLNHAFHRLALTKILNDPRTAVYLAKQRSNGKTNREAIRSLKRHLVRRVYHLLHHPNSVPITICLTLEPSAISASSVTKAHRTFLGLKSAPAPMSSAGLDLTVDWYPVVDDHRGDYDLGGQLDEPMVVAAQER